jgi:hypothetical protein
MTFAVTTGLDIAATPPAKGNVSCEQASALASAEENF